MSEFGIRLAVDEHNFDLPALHEEIDAIIRFSDGAELPLLGDVVRYDCIDEETTCIVRLRVGLPAVRIVAEQQLLLQQFLSIREHFEEDRAKPKRSSTKVRSRIRRRKNVGTPAETWTAKTLALTAAGILEATATNRFSSELFRLTNQTGGRGCRRHIHKRKWLRDRMCHWGKIDCFAIWSAMS